MPDVSRSDSQRSDSSLKHRVSFNRDVHVKRIVPRESNTRLGAQSTDGDGHLIKSTVRKERIKKTRKELAKEAAQVLQQADQLNCYTHDPSERFFSLPNRNKVKRTNSTKNPNYTTTSLDRKNTKNASNKPQTRLGRSVSAASSLQRPLKYDQQPNHKKQLSPIIENIQREDYFTPPPPPSLQNNANPTNNSNSSVTQQLKQYIDEVDRQIDEDKRKKQKIIVIDIDDAEQLTNESNLTKLKKRFKELTGGSTIRSKLPPKGRAPLVSNAKTTLLTQNNKEPIKEMMHSSQRPPEKPPLTRGRAVNRMVRQLNRETSCSPVAPPRVKATTSPNHHLQHNHNQPFSYTRGLSPDKLTNVDPIVYAQVVCPMNGNIKQTVHAFYPRQAPLNSDSDEGLEIDDFHRHQSPTKQYFGDYEEENEEEDPPIQPKYRVISPGNSFECLDERGMADGMDAARHFDSFGAQGDVSARRDQLESRITKRINSKNMFGGGGKVVSTSRRLNHHESDRFGDSGIENDLGEYHKSSRDLTVSRERSIDDGSHFDPRIDKEFYIHEQNNRYSNRRRLSTPSPSSSPTRDSDPNKRVTNNNQSSNQKNSWFKSLDRLFRKKKKNMIIKPEPNKPKSLRFFGDTDQESVTDTNTSHRPKRLTSKLRSQSSRELHNINEEQNLHHQPKSTSTTQTLTKKHQHKSMTNLKPPMSPNHHHQRRLISTSTPKSYTLDNRTQDGATKPRPRNVPNKKHEISSIESSTTEGESSQQSQRSVVYLHAATIGDIPGPRNNAKRASSSSRDDLSDRMRRQPAHIKTLSRSFSVLAPWKPRHSYEGQNIDYSIRHHEKMKEKNEKSRTGTLKNEKSRSMSTLMRNNRRNSGSSKENLTDNRNKWGSNAKIDYDDENNGRNGTLYKKKQRNGSRENSRYEVKDRSYEKKSKSTESLHRNNRKTMHRL